MIFFIASDHGGFSLKETLKKYLAAKNILVEDLGCNSNDSCDYPDFGHALAKKILSMPNSSGIAICGTGIGISMALNRHSGIRAARCVSVDDAKMSRLHNDANVLVLGGRITDKKIAEQMVDVFLATKFEGDRHKLRVKKIEI